MQNLLTLFLLPSLARIVLAGLVDANEGRRGGELMRSHSCFSGFTTTQRSSDHLDHLVHFFDVSASEAEGELPPRSTTSRGTVPVVPIGAHANCAGSGTTEGGVISGRDYTKQTYIHQPGSSSSTTTTAKFFGQAGTGFGLLPAGEQQQINPRPPIDRSKRYDRFLRQLTRSLLAEGKRAEADVLYLERIRDFWLKLDKEHNGCIGFEDFRRLMYELARSKENYDLPEPRLRSMWAVLVGGGRQPGAGRAFGQSRSPSPAGAGGGTSSSSQTYHDHGKSSTSETLINSSRSNYGTTGGASTSYDGSRDANSRAVGHDKDINHGAASSCTLIAGMRTASGDITTPGNEDKDRNASSAQPQTNLMNANQYQEHEGDSADRKNVYASYARIGLGGQELHQHHHQDKGLGAGGEHPSSSPPLAASSAGIATRSDNLVPGAVHHDPQDFNTVSFEDFVMYWLQNI
ncbi:unnamed protein product [Amoebophrya sp. A120]|nr:unnamed protein product [Amoebophrya sp. A120]|eukprot:GSA120T00026245001.1